MKYFIAIVWLLLSTNAAANSKILDIAHRGYAALNPESTLLAFQKAHEQGADGLEFDVRQTQDNVLVVTHDANVPALANRAVEDSLFSELYMETDIPSLEEVLTFSQRSGQMVWLEIKQSHRYPGIIDRVLALINQYDLKDVTVIQSFNHNDLKIINDKQPDLKLLALYTSGFSLNNVTPYSDYIGLPIAQVYLDPMMIRQLHEAGKQVIFWRRNDRSENKQVLERFIEAGADGFMLDRPLKAIMQNR